MNPKTLYLALLLGSMAFAYCNKRSSDCPSTAPYQQLTAGAKEWFPYTGNGILTFENASGGNTTIELKNYFKGDDDVWVGDECPITKGEYLRGNFIDKIANDTIALEIGFGDRVQIKKKAGFLLYYDSRAVLILANDYKRFQNNVSLNGKNYVSVLSFECAPSDQCDPLKITKFYFARGKGLVAFERNAALYTLKN